MTKNGKTKGKDITKYVKIQPKYAHLSPVYGDIHRRNQRPNTSKREEALMNNSSHYDTTALELE